MKFTRAGRFICSVPWCSQKPRGSLGSQQAQNTFWLNDHLQAWRTRWSDFPALPCPRLSGLRLEWAWSLGSFASAFHTSHGKSQVFPVAGKAFVPCPVSSSSDSLPPLCPSCSGHREAPASGSLCPCLLPSPILQVTWQSPALHLPFFLSLFSFLLTLCHHPTWHKGYSFVLFMVHLPSEIHASWEAVYIWLLSLSSQPLQQGWFVWTLSKLNVDELRGPRGHRA